jgi:hypothetical protein
MAVVRPALVALALKMQQERLEVGSVECHASHCVCQPLCVQAAALAA